MDSTNCWGTLSTVVCVQWCQYFMRSAVVAMPINLLAGTPHGQTPSTPNYGAASPAPTSASPDAPVWSQSANLDPMAFFLRF